jgi:hypothetical protein
MLEATIIIELVVGERLETLRRAIVTEHYGMSGDRPDTNAS